MSDLISRKKIRDYIKRTINPYVKPFKGTAYGLGLKIMRYIDSMDSSYDIDKVVEELEDVHNKFCKNVVCDGKSRSELCEYCEECIMFNKNIEIVKQGGVSDDVCEWRCDVYGRWHTKCHALADNDPLEYNYCPYCGKKIKVKE